MHYKQCNNIKHNGDSLFAIPTNLDEYSLAIIESDKLFLYFSKAINDFPSNIDEINETLNLITSYFASNEKSPGYYNEKFGSIDISSFIIHYIKAFKDAYDLITLPFLRFFTFWTFIQNIENNNLAQKEIFDYLFEFVISSNFDIKLRTFSLMTITNILIDSPNMRTLLQDFCNLNGIGGIIQSADATQDYLFIQITFQIINIILSAGYIDTEKTRTAFEYVTELIVNNVEMLSEEMIKFVQNLIITSENDGTKMNNLLNIIIDKNFVKLIFDKVLILKNSHQLIQQLLLMIRTMIKETYRSYKMSTKLVEQIDFGILYNFFQSNEQCSTCIKNALCDFLTSYYNSSFVTPFLNDFEFKIMNNIIPKYTKNEYVLRAGILDLYFILFIKSKANDSFNPLSINPMNLVSFLLDMIDNESEDTIEKVFSILDIFLDLVYIFPINENVQEIKEKINEIIEYALNEEYISENTTTLLLSKFKKICFE